MKIIFSILFVVLWSASCFAQEEKVQDYNKWSLEFNVGQNKPENPFAPGYFSSDPNTYFNFNGVEHVDLGVRYMFNPMFGVKVDFGYDTMSNQAGTASLPFETEQYRVGFQGVVNVSRLLKFESFTSRLGLLLHGGLQVSQLAPQSGVNDGVTEDNGGFMVGLTPQVKLTNRIVLTGDFTYLGNIRQHLNWDGSVSDPSNNLSGSLLNTSLGITIYLGKQDVHSDWYVESDQEKVTPYDDKALLEKMDELEKKLIDTDGDGVPDYKDLEPNTAGNAAVDRQGKTVKVETPPVSGVTVPATTRDVAYDAIIGAELNIMYYDINKTQPNEASMKKLPQVIDYLKKNSNIEITLAGYTDGLGSNDYNNKLAANRVEQLKKLITSYGISSSRISTQAIGEDTSVQILNKSVGNPIARRVNIIIK